MKEQHGVRQGQSRKHMGLDLDDLGVSTLQMDVGQERGEERDMDRVRRTGQQAMYPECWLEEWLSKYEGSVL